MGGDASGVDAGLLGLLLLIGLFVVSGLLGWSMIRHMRKVPASFEPASRDVPASPEPASRDVPASPDPASRDMPPSATGEAPATDERPLR